MEKRIRSWITKTSIRIDELWIYAKNYSRKCRHVYYTMRNI
ncbi:hypothetical protein [Flagellimonas flava]|nr:hypothetical protein [Allomuricauda flava]